MPSILEKSSLEISDNTSAPAGVRLVFGEYPSVQVALIDTTEAIPALHSVNVRVPTRMLSCRQLVQLAWKLQERETSNILPPCP